MTLRIGLRQLSEAPSGYSGIVPSPSPRTPDVEGFGVGLPEVLVANIGAVCAQSEDVEKLGQDGGLNLPASVARGWGQRSAGCGGNLVGNRRPEHVQSALIRS